MVYGVNFLGMNKCNAKKQIRFDNKQIAKESIIEALAT